MFTQYINKAKSGSSAAEIRTIEKDITAYIIDKNTLPPTLLDAGFSKPDPWGHPYIYVVGNPTPLLDFLGLPLNSDYDLYSSGADGASDPVVANPVTKDDIVRSNDGGFAGSRAGL
jgi:general secretion pathway protein G